MGRIFCVEFQRYPYSISYPYITICVFYSQVHFKKLLDLRARKRFWNASQHIYQTAHKRRGCCLVTIQDGLKTICQFPRCVGRSFCKKKVIKPPLDVWCRTSICANCAQHRTVHYLTAWNSDAQLEFSLVCYGPLARYVKLRVVHAPRMPGTFSPPPWVSDPYMHHGTCVTHVPWCVPRSLTFPAFPVHAQRIWQKAYCIIHCAQRSSISFNLLFYMQYGVTTQSSTDKHNGYIK